MAALTAVSNTVRSISSSRAFDSSVKSRNQCRGASRLARARQRDVARTRQSAPGNELSSEGDFPLALITALASEAIWCLWHARSMDITKAPDGAANRRRWILAGIAIAGFAIGLGFISRGQAPETG
jgi:hypothetical protein